MDEFDGFMATEKQRSRFFWLLRKLGINVELGKERVKELYKIDSFSLVNKQQLGEVIEKLEEKYESESRRHSKK